MDMFTYVAIKDTKNGSDAEACAYNRKILANGVKGEECIAVRPVSRSEADYFSWVIPAGAHFSCIEIYANGAKNLFVRDASNSFVIGYVISRPLRLEFIDGQWHDVIEKR